MKVSKCGREKTAPKELTWNEMVLNEGVYRSSPFGEATFIVVGREGNRCVLFFAADTLELAEAGWVRDKFVRTNETVCFELKPA